KEVLRRIRSGEIKCIAVDTPVPSVFSHEILNSNPYAFLDDAPLEERRARAVELRRALPESVLKEVGGLDPAAIAEVREEAWPDVRDADELADVLHTLIALPEDFYREAGPQSQSAEGTAGGQASYQGASPGTQASYHDTTLVVPYNSAELLALAPERMPLTSATWLRFFEELRDSHRATRARVREETQAGAPALHNNCDFWVSAEKAKAFRSIYPNAQFEDQIPEIPGEVP